MFTFLAQVGRHPYSKWATQILATSTGISYIGFHLFGHQIVRNIFVAQSQDGSPEIIDQELQDLISKVYADIRPNYNKPIIDMKMFKPPEPKLAWFSTSLMDPVNYGMAESITGVLIGLPTYYNYTKLEDVPDRVFQIRDVSLFSSSGKSEKSKEIDPAADLECESCGPGKLTTIDRRHPQAKNYCDSMVLSDKAKMFSIARELYMADTYRPLFHGALLVFCSLLPVQFSRSCVQTLKLQHAHVTQRMCIYILSAIVSYTNYIISEDLLDKVYNKKADERAASVSETYREGAEEYFTKILMRNKALRELVESFEHKFHPDGEVVEPLLRLCKVTLKDRIEQTKNLGEIKESS